MENLKKNGNFGQKKAVKIILTAFNIGKFKTNYSISETLMVLTIPLSLIGIAARLIR